MSMEALTIWQLTGVFCAYLFATVGLPAFVFGKKLRGHRAPERFLIYFMTGNFCVMNLVFVLQLLHISYPFTLIAATVALTMGGWIKVNHVPVRELAKDYTQNLRRLTGGQMGAKSAMYKIGTFLKKKLMLFGRWLWYFLFHRFFDCVLIALLLAALWQCYGTNLLDEFGYKATDLLVHNYWINSLSENNIFVAGVYPYGFHCMLYYLHAVFGIETFVLLRVFAFVQNVMLHLMLLLVLRLCCRTRYMAYLGTLVFAASSYFSYYTYYRYYATLPQEFGIIFILPSVYFGFAYFEARRKELREIKETALESPLEQAEKEAAPASGSAPDNSQQTTEPLSGLKKFFRRKTKRPRSKAWMYLAGFCMSFSMTLAVHFYGTMVAGLFCIAMALGYSFLFFKKQYFTQVVGTVVLSVGIAVLPMLLAFLGGTPLEGSLRWGMNIFRGNGSTQKIEQTVIESDESENISLDSDSTSVESSTVIYEDEAEIVNQNIQTDNSSVNQVVEKQQPRRSLIESLRGTWDATSLVLDSYVFNLPFKDGVKWVMWSFLGLIALGGLYLLLKHPCYGAMLISIGVYMVLMCIVMMAKNLGLPSPMDQSRGSIYFSYSFPMSLVLFFDAIVFLPFCWMRGRAEKVGRMMTGVLSLACVGGVIYYTVLTGQVKTGGHFDNQEMNEAVICLTNIIKGEKDFTWTIVSANDELRMGWDHGYHYETITFLQEMENAKSDAMIRIPSPVVYFFVEKIPQDYNLPYANSGQAISEEGASRMLPTNGGISAYQGEQRWIVMSRMYYWAEKFRELCPNEMEVYMENDNFICYRLEQNTYRLYNFAIDYGYNHWDTTVAAATD